MGRFLRVFLPTYEIKAATEPNTSASYLDCYLCIDNRKLLTRLYDKRDGFNFPILDFPFLSRNIPSAPAYGVYVYQIVHYARSCCKYQDFVDRGKLLTNELLSHGYRKAKLVSIVKKFNWRHHNLVDSYKMAVSKHISDKMASVEAT